MSLLSSTPNALASRKTSSPVAAALASCSTTSEPCAEGFGGGHDRQRNPRHDEDQPRDSLAPKLTLAGHAEVEGAREAIDHSRERRSAHEFPWARGEWRVSQETVDAMRKELDVVARSPDSVFVYSFMQATAQA